MGVAAVRDISQLIAVFRALPVLGSIMVELS